MIGQILPNNNERCYSNFSPTFREVNTPLVPEVKTKLKRGASAATIPNYTVSMLQYYYSTIQCCGAGAGKNHAKEAPRPAHARAQRRYPTSMSALSRKGSRVNWHDEL
jgi:hypothetical protein